MKKKSILTKVYSSSLASPLMFNILDFIILPPQKNTRTKTFSTRTFFINEQKAVKRDQEKGSNGKRFEGKSKYFWKKSILTKFYSSSLASPLMFNILDFIILPKKTNTRTKTFSTRTFFQNEQKAIKQDQEKGSNGKRFEG